MKLKNYLGFLLLLCIPQLHAQKDKSISAFEIEKEILQNSLKYNDPSTAIASMHRLIAIEGNSSTYKDSLALMYFKTANYLASYSVSKELLAVKANDLQLLEINAFSLKNLGANKEAIPIFEKLFFQSKNKYHGYELASLQLSLKRLVEAKQSIIYAFGCEDLKDFNLQLQIGNDKTQTVPLDAVMYNLKGLICYELQDKSCAAESFNEALKILPDFELAKQNNSVLALESGTKKQ